MSATLESFARAPVASPPPASSPKENGSLHRIAQWLNDGWQYRELVYFFAWRDIKVRYKQAMLGAAWAVLQPLLSMIVFTVVFGRLAGVSSDGLPYPLFAYAGLLVWNYFSGVIGQAGQCLTNNSNLITKVYFPRLTLPLSSAVSALLDFAVAAVFLVVLMAWYQIVPAWPMLMAPLFLVELLALTLGASLFLAALNVSYRDVKYAVPLLVQLWLFVTPVIYPISALPEKYRLLMAINPMAGIVEGLRRTMLLGEWPDPTLTAISVAATAASLVIGLVYFRRTERHFADVI